MRLILTIALRNLFRHKMKSIIIGFIIFFAAMFMTFGNSVVYLLKHNCKENMAHRFLGDIQVFAKERSSDNILFDGSHEAMRVINGYSNIVTLLQKEPTLHSFIPVNLGAVLLLESETPTFSLIFGINMNEYQKMFRTNLQIVEGRFLKDQEQGMLFSENERYNTFLQKNYWIAPQEISRIKIVSNASKKLKKNIPDLQIKTNLVIIGLAEDLGTDIRIPIKGIIRYKDYNNFWGYFCFLDIESFRQCFNYLTASDKKKTLSKNQKQILAMDNTDIENLFESSDIITDTEMVNKNYQINSLKQKIKKDESALQLDTQAYNLILIKLKPNANLMASVKQLNRKFSDNNLSVRAIPWTEASGQVYDGTNMISNILLVFIIFLYFVVIIVIMNTLNMAVIERASEIAMMRAVGTQKRIIYAMLYFEVIILSIIFGILGISAGAGIVLIINKIKFYFGESELGSIFFASDYFKPFLNIKIILISMLELMLFTSISTIYPIRIANKIKPLDAIERE